MWKKECGRVCDFLRNNFWTVFLSVLYIWVFHFTSVREYWCYVHKSVCLNKSFEWMNNSRSLLWVLSPLKRVSCFHGFKDNYYTYYVKQHLNANYEGTFQCVDLLNEHFHHWTNHFFFLHYYLYYYCYIIYNLYFQFSF